MLKDIYVYIFRLRKLRQNLRCGIEIICGIFKAVEFPLALKSGII
jgi:hypothetical protein